MFGTKRGRLGFLDGVEGERIGRQRNSGFMRLRQELVGFWFCFWLYVSILGSTCSLHSSQLGRKGDEVHSVRVVTFTID